MRAPSRPPSEDAPGATQFGSHNGRPPQAPSAPVYRLVVLAYIVAVSMPPVGFILGVILAVRFDKRVSKHGAWVIALSVVAALGWTAVVASGALNTPSTDF